MKIALVGDYDATVLAHRAIAPAALRHTTHPLITAFLMAALPA